MNNALRASKFDIELVSANLTETDREKIATLFMTAVTKVKITGRLHVWFVLSEDNIDTLHNTDLMSSIRKIKINILDPEDRPIYTYNFVVSSIRPIDEQEVVLDYSEERPPLIKYAFGGYYQK